MTETDLDRELEKIGHRNEHAHAMWVDGHPGVVAVRESLEDIPRLLAVIEMLLYVALTHMDAEARDEMLDEAAAILRGEGEK